MLRVTEVLTFFQEKPLVKWQMGQMLAWYRKDSALFNLEPKLVVSRFNTSDKKELKIGTRVHELIEGHEGGKEIKFKKADKDEVRNGIKAYLEWVSHYLPSFIEVEMEVEDREAGVVGHFDALVKIGDKRVLVDYKTSSSIRLSYWVQLAQYAKMRGGDIDEVGVVRLDKDLGTYEFQRKAVSEVSALTQVFDGLLTAVRYYKQSDDLTNLVHNDSIVDKQGGQYGRDLQVTQQSSPVQGKQLRQRIELPQTDVHDTDTCFKA
jgi:hypothetical protein